jgi:type VI secretion system protein ImpK
MNTEERDDPFLLTAFRQFYAEVLRLKAGVLASPRGGEGENDAAARAGRVSDLLLARLRRQAAEAGRRGGDWGAESYREAQYAMATLADEVFLGMAWEGRDAWANNLLETRLFGSYIGGQELFARIDELLGDPDPIRRPLAAVYLMVVSLGFEGRFEGRADSSARVAEYRRRLFAFVYPDGRSSIHGDRPLFAQAYDHVADDAVPERLPPTRRWVTALVAAVALYLVVSHGFWRSVSRGVAESSSALEQVNARAAGR